MDGGCFKGALPRIQNVSDGFDHWTDMPKGAARFKFIAGMPKGLDVLNVIDSTFRLFCMQLKAVLHVPLIILLGARIIRIVSLAIACVFFCLKLVHKLRACVFVSNLCAVPSASAA